MKISNKIIISRTDSIGDVILTLPLAGYLKSIKPDIKITFIGKTYTEPIIRASRFVDVFLDRETIIANPLLLEETEAQAILFVFPDKELAKLANSYIPIRIGTSHRWFHWLYCNKLVNFSRKNSDLHESQLNFKLLQPFKVAIPSLEAIQNFYGLGFEMTNYTEMYSHFQPRKFNLIIHPKSKGSAREWNIQNYYKLIQNLHNHDIQFFITGVEQEGNLIREQCPEIFEQPHVIDLTGKFTLTELISFIGLSDGLLACSTGTLHIAAALGIHALGLYPPMKPIHPQRWKPVGKKASYLSNDKPNCMDCKKTLNCVCMQEITVEQVSEIIKSWL
jgi:ADP-heptose:LPS heptosyltransferase